MRRKLHLTALEDRANPSRWMGDFNGPVQPPTQPPAPHGEVFLFTGPMLPPDFVTPRTVPLVTPGYIGLPGPLAQPTVWFSFDDPIPGPPPQFPIPLPDTVPPPPHLLDRIFLPGSPNSPSIPLYTVPSDRLPTVCPPGMFGPAIPICPTVPPDLWFFCYEPLPLTYVPGPTIRPFFPPIATPYEPPISEPVDLTEVWTCGNSLISH